ncbi:MAG: hypothetical protein U0821_04540 [Chloroflexota bacterium]
MPAPAPTAVAAAKPTVGPRPVLANSELVLGRNRLTVGLIGEGNRPVTDADVAFGLFQLEGAQGTKRAETRALFRWVEVESKGVYAAPVQFDAPGKWGIEVTATWPNRPAVTGRITVDVRERGAAPMIGTLPPRSKSPVAADVKDRSAICSATPPCDLHDVSIDAAVASGKPSVVLFASPGFCVTATCAPELGSVLELQKSRPNGVNYVHIEVWKDPRSQVVSDTMGEWGLQSEPWVFFLDGKGAVVDRFEGVATAGELIEAARAL